MYTAKYSATTPLNCIRKTSGTVAMNIAEGEDGPTSSTGFYNGMMPPTGGYVVIRALSGADPDYWLMENDADVINLARFTFGQTSLSTIVEALYYFMGNSNVMVIDMVPNNVVTADAHLHLDFQNLSCFPKGGDTAIDLSGNQAIGRVENGPIYKSPGVLDFDGTNDKVTYNAPLCAGLDAWSWTSTVKFDVIQESAASPYYQLYIEEFAIWIAQYAHAVGIDMRQNGASWFDGNGGTATGAQIGAGALQPGFWYNFTWTLEQPDLLTGYWNGQLVVQVPTNQSGPIATGTNTTNIGARYGSQYFNGSMRDTKTYAATLTPDQVLQNYFGGNIVANGLVFAIDAGNVVSFDPNNTYALSLYPNPDILNNNGGNLINGPTWEKLGGTWRFDGTNDRIDFDGTSILNSIGVTSGADNDVAYSMEAWIKLDAYPEGIGTQGDCIMGHNNSLGIGLQAFGNGSSAYINFGYRTNSNYNSNNITINEWHHVVGTREVGGAIKIYIDGFADYAVTGDLKVDYTTVNFGVGESPSRIGPFDGNIAIGRIYNRALTAEEVMQNFEAQRNRFGL